MAGNGGQGTTQQAQPQGFASQYMNAVNPSSQAQPAGSFYTPNVGWNQQSAVDKLGTTGLGADIRGLASGALQPAYNFSKNAGQGGQPGSGPYQPQMASQAAAPVTGAVGGAMNGAQTQQSAPNANYLPQLQGALAGWGGQQQAPMAMPWFMQWMQQPQYYAGGGGQMQYPGTGYGQMPMINSMPWQNPFLMSALYNQGTMWR